MRGGRQQVIRIRNERVKLIASFVNALAIGVIGMAVFRPMADGMVDSWWSLAAWSAIGLAMHMVPHYILGYLKSEDVDGADGTL